MLLKVDKLELGFYEAGHINKVLNQVSFELNKGEIVGIVGESGSGKSMTSLAIMDLLKGHATILGGTIVLDGVNLLELPKEERRLKKGTELSMIFQEPMTSLNPVYPIGRQVEEVLLIHGVTSKEKRYDQVIQMLTEVGLDAKSVYEKYPHELSGGMRQRVMIAIAMIANPKILIADEPTTALDATSQEQILQLLVELNKKHKTSIILISHDLGVIKKICSRAYIMYEGMVVEEGSVSKLFKTPKNDYTKRLLAAVPSKENQIVSKRENKKETEKILEVNQVDVTLLKSMGCFRKSVGQDILKEQSFILYKGEILGLLGDSGSGKSTMAKVITGLITPNRGEVIYYGGKPVMVFQDPYSSLNPVKTIEWILEEPMKIRCHYKKDERMKRVQEMLLKVGLPKSVAKRRISELSGGQRQRVAIAAALLTEAKVIVLDEPVSALDVTVQAQILNLLIELKEQFELSYIFISHDMEVVNQMCDRIIRIEKLK